MNVIKNISVNMKFYRDLRGYSQEQLAEKAGLHRTYISGIERQRRNPTISIIQDLALALEIDICDLVKDIK